VAFLAINPRSLADIEKRHSHARSPSESRALRERKLTRAMRSAFEIDCAAGQPISQTGRGRAFYCEAWPHPRISSPPWVSELVEMVGGEPAVPAGSRVTDEDVARASP